MKVHILILYFLITKICNTSSIHTSMLYWFILLYLYLLLYVVLYLYIICTYKSIRFLFQNNSLLLYDHKDNS